MPALYAQHHDQFLKNYISTLDPNIINKKCLLLGLHKSKYIFPIYVIVKVKIF